MRFRGALALVIAAALLCAAASPARAQAINWVQRGNDAVSRGQLREAIADFTAATVQLPLDPAPWYNRALAYASLGQTADSLADARHAVALQPFLDEGFALIARLEQDVGHYDAGLSSIDRAIALKPGEDAYRVRRAALLRLSNRLPEAAAEYDRVLGRDPRSIDALHGKAEIFLNEHRDPEALQLVQRYAALVPGDADANVAIAGLLVQTGRAQDGLDWIAAHPSADPRLIDYKVEALLRLGKRAAATAALPAGAAGESPFRASLRAQLAFEAGRCDEAAAAYRIASAAPGASALTWRNFGSASACAHAYPTAVNALTRAIELNPTDALARRYRASAYRALQNRDAAIADAVEALRLGGPDADLLMLLGVDEYLAGSRERGRRDFTRGCALLDPSQTAKLQRCAEQLPKMSDAKQG